MHRNVSFSRDDDTYGGVGGTAGITLHTFLHTSSARTSKGQPITVERGPFVIELRGLLPCHCRSNHGAGHLLTIDQPASCDTQRRQPKVFNATVDEMSADA